MNDFYLTTTGDLIASTSGDIALTDSPWQCDAQQAYICALTDIGDFLLYPNMGANLSSMYGMPQTQVTGDYGIQLIQSALNRTGYFATSQVRIGAVPISRSSIRFDIFITSGSQQQLKISLVQNLNLVS